MPGFSHRRLFPFGLSGIFLGLFLTLSPVQGQPGAAGTWTSLQTPHFVFFTNTPVNVARSTAYDLEEMRNVLLQLWPNMNLDSPLPTFIYVFENDASFEPFRLHGQGSPVSDEPKMVGEGFQTAGYLVPHEHGNYAALALASETRPMRFVYKQYVHQYLHQTFPTLPLWMRHGLAEYYSTFEVDGNEALLGWPIKAHRDRVRYHKEDLGLVQLLGTEEIPSDPNHAATFFARSWALMHYLQSDPDRGRKLQTYAGLVTIGDLSPIEAFQQAFQLKPAALEEGLREHIASGQFPYYRIPVDRGAHPARVRPMAPHEVHFRLGDLLARAHTDREADAGEAFRSALDLEANHGPSWAGLGYLAEKAGDSEAAHRHYAKARELAKDDFLVNYLFGRHLAHSLKGQRPSDEAQEALLAQAIEALGNAVELKPDYAPAWAELGYARNLEPKASPQAVGALERALDLLPGRLDVGFNLLLAHARLGDRDAAAEVVERMRRLDASPPTLQRAQEVLLRMDYQVAVHWVRKDRLDDAIALFAQVETESQDPALRQLASEQLEKFESTAELLRFVDLYREVGRLLTEKNLEAAVPAIDELAQMAKPGSQQEAVEKFRRALELLRNP